MKVPDDGIPLIGHGIIVGQSGTGKTNSLMIGIMRRIEAGHKLFIIDSKHELGQIFNNHAKVYNSDEAAAVIKQLIEIAEDRAIMFDEAALKFKEPVRDIIEYEKVTGTKLPVISLIIEELILIIDEIDIDELTKLFVAGRSSGVFCLVLAQYLNAKILPKKASTNLHTKVFLGPVDFVGLRTLFPGGIPKHIQTKADTFLGPAGNAMCYMDNEFTFKKLPEIDRQLLIDWMN